VAPWELLERPSAWRDWALMAEGAEAEAGEARAKLAGAGAAGFG